MVEPRIYVNGRFVTQRLTGVQRYALEVAHRLGKRISIVAPNIPLPAYEALVQSNQIEVLGKWPGHGVWGHLWEQAVFPYRIPKNGLIWSPCGAGPLLKAKHVVTVHDLAYLEHPEWFSRLFVAWYRFLVSNLARRVHKIIAVSEYTKRRIIDVLNVHQERVIVIPNGVDARFSPRSKDEVAYVSKALGIPTTHYVLSLGSLEPRKNLHRLLQAWERIQSEVPIGVWLVVGGAKGQSLVFQDVRFDRLPPRVHFTGYVPDEYLPALYSGALAFAYVSVYEGFGLPPLEAMASGTPPLTGNLTALPEVVGNAGLMVDPYDTEAIAWGLKRLIEDSALREELRRKGLERAKRFSWDKTAELTWKVLQETAQEGWL